ncbi:hypothetical protein [Caballeronia mineralivorans]|uniref:hypothetical protein n=1 Tax=Caballeronia mineralivorans TaxID=2010198 RepID=UPI002AFECD28|nr:hypothetical protein [Caballeronia mineralivorans]
MPSRTRHAPRCNLSTANAVSPVTPPERRSGNTYPYSIEKVRRLKQDHVRDRCEIDLGDGRHIAFSFHQFTALELRNHFANCFDIEDVRGLDLFHSRFMPDPRWNSDAPSGDSWLAEELERLEKAYATCAEFMDRATHLLLVAGSRRTAAPAARVVAST